MLGDLINRQASKHYSVPIVSSAIVENGLPKKNGMRQISDIPFHPYEAGIPLHFHDTSLRSSTSSPRSG